MCHVFILFLLDLLILLVVHCHHLYHHQHEQYINNNFTHRHHRSSSSSTECHSYYFFLSLGSVHKLTVTNVLIVAYSHQIVKQQYKIYHYLLLFLVVRCPRLPLPPHSVQSGCGFGFMYNVFGDRCRYYCDIGYLKINGSNE